jgi:hypothetical protein
MNFGESSRFGACPRCGFARKDGRACQQCGSGNWLGLVLGVSLLAAVVFGAIAMLPESRAPMARPAAPGFASSRPSSWTSWLPSFSFHWLSAPGSPRARVAAAGFESRPDRKSAYRTPYGPIAVEWSPSR